MKILRTKTSRRDAEDINKQVTRQMEHTRHTGGETNPDNNILGVKRKPRIDTKQGLSGPE